MWAAQKETTNPRLIKATTKTPNSLSCEYFFHYYGRKLIDSESSVGRISKTPCLDWLAKFDTRINYPYNPIAVVYNVTDLFSGLHVINYHLMLIYCFNFYVGILFDWCFAMTK